MDLRRLLGLIVAGGMKLGATGVLALSAAAGLGLVSLYVWRSGGVAKAAESIGSGAVDAVGGVASGAVGAIGSAVGLPTPAQTTTDAEVARWIIDNVSTFEASKWAGAPAFLKALVMPAGSGKPPDPVSPAGQALLGRVGPVASYDETERLLSRYPAPAVAPTGDDGINWTQIWGF